MPSFKYAELADWIRQNIYSNNYANGARIPTEKELANLFSVSRDTVRQGISQLEAEGLLTRVKGSGTYVNSTGPTPASGNSGSGKSVRIGILVNQLDNYIFPAIIRGISTVLTARGASMDIRFTSNQVSLEKPFLEAMISDGVDGLIIEPPKSALPMLNFSLYERISASIPTVLFHARYPQLNLSCITTGNNRGCYELTKYLIDKGHRNIAIICKFDEQTGTERYLGYSRALQDMNIPLIDSNICWFNSEDISSLFTDLNDTRLYSSIKNATAIICHDDRVAAQLINYLKVRNVRVPEDISVASFDNAELANELNLTTMNHPKELFGETVAENLFKKIADFSKDVSYSFTPSLIERGTVNTIDLSYNQ